MLGCDALLSASACASLREEYAPRHLVLPDVGMEGQRRLKAARVLLVEDDDTIRSLGRRTLADAGYEVIDARSPSEALARARGHGGPIDLLLSDVLLPERNGWDLSRGLQAMRPGTPVLFISGYAGNRLDGQPLLPRDAPLLQKPFTPSELLAGVREAIDRSRHGGSRLRTAP